MTVATLGRTLILATVLGVMGGSRGGEPVLTVPDIAPADGGQNTDSGRPQLLLPAPETRVLPSPQSPESSDTLIASWFPSLTRRSSGALVFFGAGSLSERFFGFDPRFAGAAAIKMGRDPAGAGLKSRNGKEAAKPDRHDTDAHAPADAVSMTPDAPDGESRGVAATLPELSFGVGERIGLDVVDVNVGLAEFRFRELARMASRDRNGESGIGFAGNERDAPVGVDEADLGGDTMPDEAAAPGEPAADSGMDDADMVGAPDLDAGFGVLMPGVGGDESHAEERIITELQRLADSLAGAGEDGPDAGDGAGWRMAAETPGGDGGGMVLLKNEFTPENLDKGIRVVFSHGYRPWLLQVKEEGADTPPTSELVYFAELPAGSLEVKEMVRERMESLLTSGGTGEVRALLVTDKTYMQGVLGGTVDAAPGFLIRCDSGNLFEILYLSDCSHVVRLSSDGGARQ